MGRLDSRQQQLMEAGFVEERAAGVGTGAAGGYTVPVEFLAKLIEVIKSFGGILAVADVITTDSGAPMQWPTERRHRQHRRDPVREHGRSPSRT
jgi:HK97 family phage major capsid protein